MNHRRKYFSITLFFFLGLFALTSHSQTEVGFSEGKILIPEGTSLAGYLPRRVFRNFDSPYASYFKSSVGFSNLPRTKVIAIKSNSQIVLIATIDVIAIDPEMRKQAEALLQNKFKEKISLYLIATHTHSGPGGFSKFELWQHLAIDKFNNQIFDLFLNSIIDSSTQAISNFKKAKMSFQSIAIDEVTYNRRRSLFLNPKANLITFINEDNKKIVSLFNFPIHGTVLGPKNLYLSGDLPNLLEVKLQKSFQHPFMFISGAAGDVGPKLDKNKYFELDSAGDFVLMETLVENIVGQVISKWNQTESSELKTISHQTFYIDLPKANVNLSRCLEFVLPKKFQWISKLFFNVSMPQDLNKPMELSIMKWNNLHFYLIPGEPITEIGKLIESKSLEYNLTNPILFTLANSYYGYILTKNEFQRGGYESCNSFYGSSYGENFLSGVYNSIQKFSSIQ